MFHSIDINPDFGVATFFSFFTIESNVFVALRRRRGGRRGIAVGVIAMTGLVMWVGDHLRLIALAWSSADPQPTPA